MDCAQIFLLQIIEQSSHIEQYKIIFFVIFKTIQKKLSFTIFNNLITFNKMDHKYPKNSTTLSYIKLSRQQLFVFTFTILYIAVNFIYILLVIILSSRNFNYFSLFQLTLSPLLIIISRSTFRQMALSHDFRCMSRPSI